MNTATSQCKISEHRTAQHVPQHVRPSQAASEKPKETQARWAPDSPEADNELVLQNDSRDLVAEVAYIVCRNKHCQKVHVKFQNVQFTRELPKGRLATKDA